MKTSSILLTLTILLTQQSLVFCQSPIRLNISFVSDPFSGVPTYSWGYTGDVFVNVTSPGGTEMGPFESAEFETFDELHQDIIGTWVVTTDSTSDQATFDLLTFLELDFVEIELDAPFDGQHFLDGDIVQIEATPATINYALRTPIGATSDLLGGGAFQVFLDEGVNQVTVQTYAINQEFSTEVISNISGDLGALPVCDEVRVISTSKKAHLVFSSTTSLLGDVNRDGAIDLLDVVPFVNVLTNGSYQFEADINGDQTVDLLDVAGFIDFFT